MRGADARRSASSAADGAGRSRNSGAPDAPSASSRAQAASYGADFPLGSGFRPLPGTASASAASLPTSSTLHADSRVKATQGWALGQSDEAMGITMVRCCHTKSSVSTRAHIRRHKQAKGTRSSACFAGLPDLLAWPVRSTLQRPRTCHVHKSMNHRATPFSSAKSALAWTGASTKRTCMRAHSL